MLRAQPQIVADFLRGRGVHLEEAASCKELGAAFSAPVTELRPDLVLASEQAGAVRLVAIVEVQMQRDDDERFVWPAYEAMARHRHRAPVRLVVLAPDRSVARWARKPIFLAAGGRSVCVPTVIGPEDVPAELSDEAPVELAMLSALTHGRERRAGRAAILRAMRALDRIETARALLYFEFLADKIGIAVDRAAEAYMSEGYKSEFLRKLHAKGKAEGKADALVAVLEARAFVLTADARARIDSCRDAAVLQRWISRAVTATSLDEVFAGPA
jgi:hypothetical protein